MVILCSNYAGQMRPPARWSVIYILLYHSEKTIAHASIYFSTGKKSVDQLFFFFYLFYLLWFTCVRQYIYIYIFKTLGVFFFNFLLFLNFSELLNSSDLHQNCERETLFLPFALSFCHSFHLFVSRLEGALWKVFNALSLSAFVVCSFYRLPISRFLLLSPISLNQGDMTSTALLWWQSHWYGGSVDGSIYRVRTFSFFFLLSVSCQAVLVCSHACLYEQEYVRRCMFAGLFRCLLAGSLSCGLLQMFSGPGTSCQLLRPQNTHTVLLIKRPAPRRATRRDCVTHVAQSLSRSAGVALEAPWSWWWWCG